jgi:peptidoglycan/xylan/chitin deacetylase (PgdA/CDA1 family)
MQQLIASGHEICSHTVSHPFLTSLSSTNLNYEIQHSQDFIKTVAQGQPISAIASSYGMHEHMISDLVCMHQ